MFLVSVLLAIQIWGCLLRVHLGSHQVCFPCTFMMMVKWLCFHMKHILIERFLTREFYVFTLDEEKSSNFVKIYVCKGILWTFFSGKSNPIGAIVGGIAAGVILLFAILVGTLVWRQRQNRKRKENFIDIPGKSTCRYSCDLIHFGTTMVVLCYSYSWTNI